MNKLCIEVEDLIGLPYRSGGVNPREGVDCRFATREALDRIFPDLEPHEFPLSADEEEVMLTRVRAGETRWSLVGTSAAAATKLGDVLQGRKPDGGAFVAVIVNQVTRAALTALPKTGVRLISLRALAGVEGVFRRRPAT